MEKWNIRSWFIWFYENMKNNTTPNNDGLTKEFYETFWDELKLFKWKVLTVLSTLKSRVFQQAISLWDRRLMSLLNVNP